MTLHLVESGNTPANKQENETVKESFTIAGQNYDLTFNGKKFFLRNEQGKSFPGLENGFDGIPSEADEAIFRQEVRTSTDSWNALNPQEKKVVPAYMLIVNSGQIWSILLKTGKLERIKTATGVKTKYH